MSKRSIFQIILSILAISLVIACASLRTSYQVPYQHPAEAQIKGRPVCTDCHETGEENLAHERFNHTPYFAEHHRIEARQNKQVCDMCHQESFCNDCHATWTELSPAVKLQAETYRRAPHRGNYASRHGIDGRMDPVSCYRCHGNPKTSKTCVPCHG